MSLLLYITLCLYVEAMIRDLKVITSDLNMSLIEFGMKQLRDKRKARLALKYAILLHMDLLKYVLK